MPVPVEVQHKKKPERIVDPEAAMFAWNAIDLLLLESGAHGMSPEMVYRVGRVMVQMLMDHREVSDANSR